MIYFEIDIPRTRQLKEIASDANSTMFMTLLALYNILLSKLCHQHDIVVGTPVAGRPHADFENIIGMFVNLLALRNFPAPEKTVAQFLKDVRQNALTAFENQDYQFDDLVDKLLPDRDLSRNPMLDVILSLQNVEGAPEQLDASGPSALERLQKEQQPPHRTTKFDLVLHGGETHSGLLLAFEYNKAIFKKESITRFVEYFKTLVSEITGDNGRQKTIGDIEIISEEKRKLLDNAVGEEKSDAANLVADFEY
jgi:non-ribosomal peptide synthetase component F